MVRGIANSKIGFGDLILLLRYFFKLKVSTHPNIKKITNLEFKPMTFPELKFKDYLHPKPKPSGLDVQCKLQHFALITYVVDPARFKRSFLHGLS